MREPCYTLSLPGFSNKEEIVLAFLTDLHQEAFDPLLDSLDHHQPDGILFAGDLLRGRGLTRGQVARAMEEDLLPLMEALVKRGPTIFSLGNHDQYLSAQDLRRLEETGACLVAESFTERWGLKIGGLSSGQVALFRRDPASVLARERSFLNQKFYFLRRLISRPKKEAPPNLDFLEAFSNQPGCKLLLCHHPEYWPKIEAYPIALTLSGHAHGGQIRLPFTKGRGLYAPGQGFFPRFSGGLYEGGRGKLLVSRGLSNTARPLPRLGNPTELVYIRLLAAQGGEDAPDRPAFEKGRALPYNKKEE